MWEKKKKRISSQRSCDTFRRDFQILGWSSASFFLAGLVALYWSTVPLITAQTHSQGQKLANLSPLSESASPRWRPTSKSSSSKSTDSSETMSVFPSPSGRTTNEPPAAGSLSRISSETSTPTKLYCRYLPFPDAIVYAVTPYVRLYCLREAYGGTQVVITGDQLIPVSF